MKERKKYPIGISGILRCKNCDDFLEACIDSVIDALDELVAVYHECTDRTVAILERKRQQYHDQWRQRHSRQLWWRGRYRWRIQRNSA